MPASYTLCQDGGLWSVAHETTSVRKPVRIRVVWRPKDPRHRMLLPDRLIGQPVGSNRQTEQDTAADVQRWVVSDPLMGTTIELLTPLRGDCEEAGWVPRPTGRGSRSTVWFWDAGAWSPSRTFCSTETHWHLMPGDRTPRPPTDPLVAKEKSAL